ncbi:universal stress protein [Halobacteriales archaeon QS_8_69_26]|nr:MAG: universal stress protein [Halobacteriales archaeon QS_8_69_26]
MRVAGLGILSGASGGPSDGPSTVAGGLAGEHILAPLIASQGSATTDQVRVAAALARSTDASLHVSDPVAGGDAPAPGPRADLTAEAEERILDWAVERVSPPGPRRVGISGARTLARGILGAVERHDVDTLVVPGGSAAGLLRRGLTERLAVHADCDVVTVAGNTGYERVPSVLLAVADGPHSGLATDVAGRVAAENDAWVDVLHVVPEDPPDRRREAARACVEAATERIGRPGSTSTWVLEAADPAEAIVEQSQYYGLTVVGAPTKGRLRRFIAGSTTGSVRREARSVVLSVRNNR